MGITDSKFPFCHGILEENGDKEVTLRGYNDIKVYDYYDNNLMDDCGIPYLPIDIDDSHLPNKTAYK